MFAASSSRRGLLLSGALFGVLLALSLAGPVRGADDNALSVDEMVHQLKGGEAGAAGEARTRGLRPGAAAKGGSAAGQAGQAPSGSLSMRVQFDFDSDRLSPASHAVLQKLASALTSGELANYAFTVIGHTDAVGSAQYNRALSQRRAASVKTYLIGQGVQASRIGAEGRGFGELLDPADPRSAANRRVEITATPR